MLPVLRPDIVVDMNACFIAFDVQAPPFLDLQFRSALLSFNSSGQILIELVALVISHQDKIEQAVGGIGARGKAKIGPHGANVHRFQ